MGEMGQSSDSMLVFEKTRLGVMGASGGKHGCVWHMRKSMGVCHMRKSMGV